MTLTFSLADLMEATRGTAPRGDPSCLVAGICTDTRQIKAGDWFLALQGPNFDGHDFVRRAIELGAPGAIVSRDLGPEILGLRFPVLRVADTLTAYGDIARAWRRRIDPTVACIAGSSGKTTTKEMAAAVLASHEEALVSPGNFNNLIGLPNTLLRLTGEHRLVVAEIGMNARGELEQLTSIAEPDLAALLNVGNAHVGRLGAIEDLMEAKAELLIAMKSGTRLLANADCPRSAAIVERYGRHLGVVWFAAACRAPYRAESIERLKPWGYVFDWLYPKGRERVEVHAFGRHNVANAVCAAAMLYELGFDPREIAEGLGRFQPAHMRSHAYWAGPEDTPTLVIEDCYNASAASTLAVLESLRDLEISGRFHLALGDMLELGQGEEAYHRQVGEAAARHRGARIYGVGPRSRWTIEAARAAGAEAVWFDSPDKAVEKIAAAVGPGDAVLIKASRLMEFEKLAAALRRRLEGRNEDREQG